MKISIVMAYYNRKQQTIFTLDTISKSKHQDYEVIIVDDGSSSENRLEDVIYKYKFPIKLIRIEPLNKKWINPCIPYNIGFKHASGDIIIIQNPEVCYIGDIISYVNNQLYNKHDMYLSFRCFASPSFEYNDRLKKICKRFYYKRIKERFIDKINWNNFSFNWRYYVDKYKNLKIKNYSQALSHWNRFGIKENRQCNKSNIYHPAEYIKWKGWYNHEEYNPRALHFLTATHKKNIDKINGFNEEYQNGLWYDDTDFIKRMKLVTNLKYVTDDEYFGIHQYHNSGSIDLIKQNNFKQHIKSNKKIYSLLNQQISKGNNFVYNWKNSNKNTISDNAIYNIYDNIKSKTEIIRSSHTNNLVDKNTNTNELVDDKTTSDNAIYTNIKTKITKEQSCLDYNKLIIFGSNGMLGTYIAKYFKEQYFNVINITRKEYDVMEKTFCDLENLLIDNGINNKTVIFNAIGVIPQRLNKHNEALNNQKYIKINSIFPNILDQICKKYDAKLIHPTTDCVFDGSKGKYDETDIHNAKYIYGITKSLGEPSDATVIRSSIIGEEIYNKKSLLEWVCSNKDGEIDGYIDHYWNGITCLQYAKIVYQIVAENLFWKGVRHILSPNSISKYKLVNIINDVYKLNIKINSKEGIKRCDKTLCTINSVNRKFNIPDLETQIMELKYYHSFKYPRILHLFWSGILPFLNYLTVVTFKKYHPKWEINVYVTSKTHKNIKWETGEQNHQILCYDYMRELEKDSSINIINVNKICIKLGIFNLNCIYQSDILRVYFLSKVGGIWSDFDIIYIKNIENIFNKYKKDIVFKLKDGETNYFPVAFFLCNGKKNNIFCKILKEQLKILNKNEKDYQKYGADLYNKMFYLGNDINKKNKMKKKYSIEILGKSYYLPYECYQLKSLYNNIDTGQITENTVGVHWFNGADIAREYVSRLNKLHHSKFKIKCTMDVLIKDYIKYKKQIVTKKTVKNKHNTIYNKNIALICESSYPGGGGEEFMYDISVYFNKLNLNVYWFNFHDWGKKTHRSYNKIERDTYTEINLNYNIRDLNIFQILKQEMAKYNINYIFHQGYGHKFVTDIGNVLNIPTITIWCFWEEALEINPSYGLIDINKNIKQHNKTNNFHHIINNIDYFYFASKFVKDTLENKYKIKFDDDHIFPTLSQNNRYLLKNKSDNFHSKYITLLDVHTLKGGKIMAELINRLHNLNFLGIKTEDENNGPESILKSIKKINNSNSKLLLKRVNNVKHIYMDTKILLCPTYLDETFCRVVFEAYANKIPVICSNKGNLGYLDEKNLLIIKDFSIDKYVKYIIKLVNDKNFYNMVVETQYKIYKKIKKESNFDRIMNKYIEIDNNKNKNIGIFTPWCDQGLGIQSRIYKKIFEECGYNIFIFSTKPYVKTECNGLIGNEYEWETNNIYRSPNRRLDVNMLEFDLFVTNYKIRKMIIPEIQYDKIFEITEYLKIKYNIDTYAIPNVECIRNNELKKFKKFKKILVNNKMTYNLLTELKVPNVEYFGFTYDIMDKLDVKYIKKKNIGSRGKIQLLHLSGLNGLFRKRTMEIIKILDKIYNDGVQNFVLNLVIQGNFDNNLLHKLDQPFINLIYKHCSYADILNMYNQNHISIQISKHEGLGLGFFESCFMGTPVITLNAPPHNEIIHHKKNGWLLPAWVEKDKKPENPFTIIGQVQVDLNIIEDRIKNILMNIDEINIVMNNTKSYTDKIYNINDFKKRLINIMNS